MIVGTQNYHKRPKLTNLHDQQRHHFDISPLRQKRRSNHSFSRGENLKLPNLDKIHSTSTLHYRNRNFALQKQENNNPTHRSKFCSTPNEILKTPLLPKSLKEPISQIRVLPLNLSSSTD